MQLCQDLGMTLVELTNRMTYEELILWSSFYQWQTEQQAEAQMRRR
jgi:hypothetical protein